MIKQRKKHWKPLTTYTAKDITIVSGLIVIFHCSRATIYRAIKEYNLPMWHFNECLIGSKFISKFNLYRLIKSPVFKKYFKRLEYYAEIPDGTENDWSTPLSEVGKKLNLTEKELDAGVKSGFIPCIKINNEIKACGWFLPAAERVYPCF